jgi:MFS family permease
MLELFRDRRFRLLFAAQSATAAGESVMLLVLPVWMKVLTGSSSLAGTVMLAVALPMLVSPVLGWLADRVPRRTLLIGVHLGTAAALLPLYAVRTPGQAWIILVVAVLYGTSFVLASAGLAGLIQHTVPDERLADANGALRTMRESLRLIAPVAGAGLYAVLGAVPVITLNVLCLLVAAAVLLILRVHETVSRGVELTWFAEASAGFRFLFGEAALRPTAFGMAAAFLAFGTLEAGAFAYVDEGLHRPAPFVGVLVAIMGVGSVVGGVLAPRLIGRLGETATLAVGLACLAAGLGPLILPHVEAGLLSVPFAGIGVAVASVAFATIMQRRTPRPLMGRVSAAVDLLTGLPQNASLAVSSALVSTIDYRWLFGADTIGLVVIAGLLWRVRARARAVTPAAEPPHRSAGAEVV